MSAKQSIRLPKSSPVVALHLRADNDVNGNPRRVFLVLDHHGRTVETIDEGYYGEGALYSRYPWFQHIAASRLGLECAYAVSIDTTPAEYRHMLKRSGDERCERIRRMADRYAARFTDFGVAR